MALDPELFGAYFYQALELVSRDSAVDDHKELKKNIKKQLDDL